ncbi:hypothetical protein ACT17Q_14900 [Cellulomonas sp. CW35]|uniref:hypothetical protein n=1 Tax=Cellulomonas sp. CW35 TaxID=3458249 RepID=UPI004034D801
MAGDGTTSAERYRAHEVWDRIDLQIESLRTKVYGTPNAEVERKRLIAILEYAARSRRHAVPAVYDDLLDTIQNAINAIPADEHSFINSYVPRGEVNSLAMHTRQLPGPPARELADKYVAVLDDAASARQEELAGLREEVGRLTDEIDQLRTTLAKLTDQAKRAAQSVESSNAVITSTAEAAATQLETAWSNKLTAWETDRERRDKELDDQMATHLGLLTAAAQVGQRLVEHAAGRHTALDWTRRAERERTNGTRLRLGALVAFAGAVLVGGAIAWRALMDGFTLTLGDGILRAAIVASIAGVGTYLAAESRRHLHEADSAEEVATALTTIEPFYASADGSVREAARTAVGDTVFVRNVLSRFTSRDASRHGQIANQQLSEIIDLLSKSIETAKAIEPGKKSA